MTKKYLCTRDLIPNLHPYNIKPRRLIGDINLIGLVERLRQNIVYNHLTKGIIDLQPHIFSFWQIEGDTKIKGAVVNCIWLTNA